MTFTNADRAEDMHPTEARRLIEALEGEVNNGGFDQYFFNRAGDEASAAVSALTAVGALTTARLLMDACAKFPGGMPSSNRLARQEALELLNPAVAVFSALDATFYDYPDDLSGLLDAYEAGHIK